LEEGQLKKYILLILFLASIPLVISTPPPPPDIQLISQDSEKQVSSSINIPNQNAVGQSTIYETNNEASYTIGSNDNGRISVTRTIKPSSTDYYLLNRNYSVDVLVSGIGRDLDDVIIKEKLDPSLQLINFSKLSPQVNRPLR